MLSSNMERLRTGATMNNQSARFGAERWDLIGWLFPRGIPRLWCPSLTHYKANGNLDQVRMRAHLEFMRPWIGGFLIPGSTGEGWEMSDVEVRELLGFTIGEIRAVGASVLIGALKANVEDAVRLITETIGWLKRQTGTEDALEALMRSSVCGFAVCPPTGEKLSQSEIGGGLETVLAIGVPVSLYQLPQVTRNEVAPDTVEVLSVKFPGFYLFKDSSGNDRVAASGFRQGFLLRGAEGDYARHLRAAGGNYDGFLLSTANCFGRQLHAMIEQIESGHYADAQPFSNSLSAVCDELFSVAGKLGYGNAFTNANKALDYFFAHGAAVAKVPPPLLHSGRRLPAELIEAAGQALNRHRLMPSRGYLE
jgi:dihydrodipicolinate synthase/N-acetylneuraminate lyase